VHYYLRCKVCKKEFAGDSGHYKCPDCGGKLEIRYVELPQVSHLPALMDPSKPGIWKFWRLLPVDNPEDALSLGEGNTFLHECKSLARQLGFRELWVKDEGRNPTGSFKDRNAAVSVTKAVEFGAKGVAIASDGNAGPAVAAYAAKAQLPCFVFMPTITAPQRAAQAAVFGARVIKIEGKGLVNNCIDLIEELKASFGWHHLTTAGPVNPYQLEAPKTIAYEIAIDLDGYIPDWIVAPAGGGGLIAALFKGFEELNQMGLINQIPRFLCVQSSGCAPIVEAFRNGSVIKKWTNPKPTIAVPISVPFPLEGEEVLQALQVSEGMAIDVNDEEIFGAQKSLAEKEGIFASPAGVSALAGAIKARHQGVIHEEDTVLVVVTGSGLKDLGQLVVQAQIPTLAADPEAVKKFLYQKAKINSEKGGGTKEE